MSVMRGQSEETKQNGISLHPLDMAAASEPELLCIFGTGDLGRSLGLQLLQSGYGSRRPHSCGPLPQGAQVRTYVEAVQSSHLIFICVHRELYEFLTTMEHDLKGKVLVDLSNNLKKGKTRSQCCLLAECSLAKQILVPSAAVVTGLNTPSTWALQNGLLAGKQIHSGAVALSHLHSDGDLVCRPSPAVTGAVIYLNCVHVFLCGESEEAKQAVAQLATKLGLTVLDKGSLFPEWRLPLSKAVGLTAFFSFYLLIRDVIYAYVEKKDEISYRIMLSLANKLYRGTKYRRFPNWLDRWMLCRKQMGLVALGCAFLHVIYTFIIPICYSVRHKLISGVVDENNKTAPFYFDNTEAWGTDSFISLGILGFFFFVLLGLTSLPSVGGSLSWREFNFIQSKLGHLTLFISTAQSYIYGWNKFLQPSTYKWYRPPGYMLYLIVPSVVYFFSFLVWTAPSPEFDKAKNGLSQSKWACQRQGHHDSEGDVSPLVNVRIDDISGEKIEEEEGSEANGEAHGQPPLGEQLQGEVLQLSGCRQRPSILNSEAQFVHTRHCSTYLSSWRNGAAAVRSPAAIHQPKPTLQQTLTQRAPQVSRPKDAHRLLFRVMAGIEVQRAECPRMNFLNAHVRSCFAFWAISQHSQKGHV
ncbi:hypothetical protein CCH79_00007670 [Gambusia affinis]|uniref:Pyrroline-5-carboxylate reductase catalytic N-terminal domain-containing protein n=1 Tax=Gambusia affinis TaxID=33528 RepID=A0A315WC92_GAMAF|nr:hypothetical protein CCH79_00007670 [Gambusia affinis]